MPHPYQMNTQKYKKILKKTDRLGGVDVLVLGYAFVGFLQLLWVLC